MAKCDYCNSTILFGGVQDEDLRFCNEKCHQNGFVLVVAREVPEDVLRQNVLEIHAGLCPVCEGRGPVDVHTAHRVWSALVLTSWSSTPQISCRACGRKSQVAGLFFSLFLGWWGFPWGLIMTPVQIVRNLAGIMKEPDSLRPSPQLEKLIRIEMAAYALEQMAEQEQHAAEEQVDQS